MDYVVCTNHDLRMACIDNHWFTAGTNSQYDKLFEMNSNTRNFRLKEIAAVIYVCSEKAMLKSLRNFWNCKAAICTA